MEKKIISNIIPVDEKKPGWAQIVPILIDGRLPMVAQWRPPGEWWTLGMANASKIEAKKKCVTHWIELSMADQDQADKNKLIAEDILKSQFIKGMKNKDFTSFKKAYPTLMGVILRAMEEFRCQKSND